MNWFKTLWIKFITSTVRLFRTVRIKLTKRCGECVWFIDDPTFDWCCSCTKRQPRWRGENYEKSERFVACKHYKERK